MDLLKEIYEEAFRWYNLPFSVLFCLVLIYWMLNAIFGLFGAVLDFDFDFDADAADPEAAGGFMSSFSRALSDGEAPFMVAVSFFTTLMWATMMTLNWFFNPKSVWLIGIAIMAGSLAVAIYVTRLFMRFFVRLFRKIFGMTPQKENFIGAVGVVTTSEVTERFGQIQLDRGGVPILFNVDLLPGSPPLAKGDYARIVSKGRAGKTWLVEKTAEEPHLAPVKEGSK